jgi:hypothetical protein
MANAEAYGRWIIENADKRGTPEFDTVAAAYKAARGEQPREELFAEKLGRSVLNAGAGAIRGAGSIGATLFAPFDAAEGAMRRAMGVPVAGDSLNQQRRAGMTAGLGSMGADTDSIAFGAGKLGGEIAGTLGVGGALANAGARVLPAVAAPLLDAVRTAGFLAGGVTGRAGLGIRTAGGAITGAASAGAVNPEDAASGALIGAAAPGVLQAAGRAGQAVGNVIRGGEQAPEVAAAIRQARSAGYVIPPTQANPSLANRTIEGFAGKLTTAQNASAKNQAVTNRLAAKAIGLPDDAPLTPEVLDGVRAEAGKAYAAISKLGKFDATGVQLPKEVAVENGISPLLAGKTKSVDAGELVRAWKQSNADATAYYRAYGRDANPETLAKAKAAANAAKQIDDFMVKRVGAIDASLTNSLKAARQRIAKTYSVESAMNPLTGTVDARKLAKQLEKGKMLSGDLLSAAQFAGRFPKAAQTVEGMGSLPQTSPLDWIPAGALSMATSNPLMMAGVAARPAARAYALSGLLQDGLVQGQPSAMTGLLASPEFQMNVLRAAPNALIGQ